MLEQRGQQSRSRSDSEYSTDPLIDPAALPRKRNHLSESELPNESTATAAAPLISPSSSAPPTPVPSSSSLSSATATTTTNNNKSNLARTAILLAAKRAASHSNNPSTNNYDGSTFNLIDGTEDEPDSSAGLFKQRFEMIDFTDEVRTISFHRH
jgi:hypothetical protein